MFVSVPRTEKDSAQRKLRCEPGASEVRLHVFVRMASVGQTHRALSPPKGRKAPRRCKNASQKEAPSLSDKRQERRDGEPVRVHVTIPKDCRLHGVTSFGS